MAEIINLSDRRSKPQVTAETSDLAEAFAIAAILVQEWQQLTHEIRMGKTQLVGLDFLPLANPYPAEPTVAFAGVTKTASEICELAVHLVGQPLPPLMRVVFAIWNADDPDDPILTYADAVEMVEAVIDFSLSDQGEPPLRRTGGHA